MSKFDELLAEIDAAVERLNRARARLAALDYGPTKSRFSPEEYGQLFGILAYDAECEASDLASLLRVFAEERAG